MEHACIAFRKWEIEKSLILMVDQEFQVAIASLLRCVPKYVRYVANYVLG